MDPTTTLLHRASGRHGVITRSEARHAGLTDRQIRLRLATGEWVRHSSDVFIAAGAPRTHRQSLLAAAARHDAAASCLHAAWLHGLYEFPTGKPHVARASPGGSRDSSAVVHRVADLRTSDIVTVDSIPATSATRTILDVACIVSDVELRAMIDRARGSGLTHPDVLIARFLELAPHRRAGTARARRVLRGVDQDLGLLESDLEALLLGAIVDAGLPAPVPQYAVAIGAARYRLDFAYPAHLLAIEGDGFEFHAGRDQFENDRRRQNDLVLAGWRILRFTWRQLCNSSDDVVCQIASALGEQHRSALR